MRLKQWPKKVDKLNSLRNILNYKFNDVQTAFKPNTPDRVLLPIKSSAYIYRAAHFERADKVDRETWRQGEGEKGQLKRTNRINK
jgi:hypothetical protein